MSHRSVTVTDMDTHGPHTALVNNTLQRIVDLGTDGIADAHRPHLSDATRRTIISVSGWSSTLGRMNPHDPLWDHALALAAAEPTGPRLVNPGWAFILDGIHAIVVADLLTPEQYTQLTAGLVAAIGPVPRPDDHILCQPVCTTPLGWHLALAYWNQNLCDCEKAFPGMSMTETAVSYALMFDKPTDWVELLANAKRLVI